MCLVCNQFTILFTTSNIFMTQDSRTVSYYVFPIHLQRTARLKSCLNCWWIKNLTEEENKKGQTRWMRFDAGTRFSPVKYIFSMFCPRRIDRIKAKVTSPTSSLLLFFSLLFFIRILAYHPSIFSVLPPLLHSYSSCLVCF